MGEYVLYERLEDVVENEKSRGNIIVLTGGCFDVLHPGHIYLLEVSAGFGDVLMINIANDNRIREYKDKNGPVMDEMERVRVVSGMEWVDYATIYPSVKTNPTIDLAFLLKPDILIQSKLPSPGEMEKLKYAGVAFQFIGRSPEGISSGEIRDRIRKHDPRKRRGRGFLNGIFT